MLKKIIFFLFLATCFPFFTQAKILNFKECEMLGDLSKQVMESRQYGSRKETVQRHIRDANLGELEEFFLKIVEQAYIFPKHTTKEEKLKEIDKFTAMTLAVCMQKK